MNSDFVLKFKVIPSASAHDTPSVFFSLKIDKDDRLITKREPLDVFIGSLTWALFQKAEKCYGENRITPSSKPLVGFNLWPIPSVSVEFLGCKWSYEFTVYQADRDMQHLDLQEQLRDFAGQYFAWLECRFSSFPFRSLTDSDPTITLDWLMQDGETPF